ncbi:thiaminase II [Sediminibacillus dalangtanensis]|uniref:Aminopyrimidine aminohydrolase n=1 Tax=Sediminibacillus dalangtanensis TaxID=2729421 RepID=A0ABX7VMJ3_9BACI|nr:thiaminase II [Sediminibacillus dalangtanensis]QTM98029.1 thiaminase II [Sediminibacillus dalangtanensis]
MTFSEQLRKQADEVFEGILQHPFIRGIAEGNVPKQALIHYVKADYEYLSAFNRIYGLAISKCEDRSDMGFFQEQIGFVLNSEIHPHENFCRVAGVNYDDLQGSPLPPTADHYVAHMSKAAYSGTMGETLAALLPCPWTYLEIGRAILEEKQPDTSHPFYEWISFYADGEIAEVTHELCRKIDRWASNASEQDKQKAAQAFIKSCQLEYRFWDMAYTQEEWPFSLSSDQQIQTFH